MSGGVEGLLDLIVEGVSNPAVAALVIIAATFILEDAATVGAALLAGDGLIDPWLALAALFVGIVLGDIGLYGFGRLARTHTLARRWVDTARARALRGWARGRLWSVIFTSRLVPGLRLPTYVGAGFIATPFAPFCRAVVAAVALWTAALFAAVYWLGRAVVSEMGPAKWLAMAAIVVVVIVAERTISRRLGQAGSDAP